MTVQSIVLRESKAVLWLSRKEAYDWLAVSAMGGGIENGMLVMQ